MGQYGTAACIATDLLNEGSASDPRKAWEEAISRVTKSQSSQKKSCPKSTFLGLCEEGFVRGVSPGDYTSSPENKRHAIQALMALRANPSLANRRGALWETVTEGSGKIENGQLDVVVTLWRREKLR